MKTNKVNNIIALCLGIIAAALLWEYYLKPKYNIRRGHEATLKALYEADIKALNEATSAIEGEVVARSDRDYSEEDEDFKEDVLSTRNMGDIDFAFHSAANKPRTLDEIAAAGDKRRATKIILPDEELTAKAKIAHQVPAGYQAEDIAETDEGEIVSGDPKSRFTMLIAPVKYNLIKGKAAYVKFLLENRGIYPDVDFKRDMIILLESDGQLAHGFFQIDKVEESEQEITVYYKVNIIGSSERLDAMAYHVLPQSGKTINLQQVK